VFSESPVPSLVVIEQFSLPDVLKAGCRSIGPRDGHLGRIAEHHCRRWESTG
jgi:hypothetical protein